MCKEYLVTWSANITADTPQKAALEAQAILSDRYAVPTVFQVEVEGAGGDALEVDTLDLNEDEKV